jgi:hypothetical protein
MELMALLVIILPLLVWAILQTQINSLEKRIMELEKTSYRLSLPKGAGGAA